MTTRLKQFLDEYNRIVFSQKDKKLFYETVLRHTPEGPVPVKTVIDGKWSLTENHDLRLTLSGADSAFIGRTVIFRGDILRPSSTGLSFRIRSCDALSGAKSRTIQLKGVWAADSKNRITFRVSKLEGRYDVLTFNGTWKIGRNNELLYKIVKTQLKTKIKKEKTITFRGYWDLSRTRIVYRVEGSADSSFSFKAAIRSKSLMAKEGVIRYQLGTVYSSLPRRGETFLRTVTIYGTWKLGRDLSVRFQLKSLGSKKREILFEVAKMFVKKRKITVALKNRQGQKLGLDVTFTRVVSKDTEFFISLSRNPSENRILGGVRLRF